MINPWDWGGVHLSRQTLMRSRRSILLKCQPKTAGAKPWKNSHVSHFSCCLSVPIREAKFEYPHDLQLKCVPQKREKIFGYGPGKKKNWLRKPPRFDRCLIDVWWFWSFAFTLHHQWCFDTYFSHCYSVTNNRSGWWFQTLWKIWKSIGMMRFPLYGKIKNGNQTTNQRCNNHPSLPPGTQFFSHNASPGAAIVSFFGGLVAADRQWLCYFCWGNSLETFRRQETSWNIYFVAWKFPTSNVFGVSKNVGTARLLKLKFFFCNSCSNIGLETGCWYTTGAGSTAQNAGNGDEWHPTSPPFRLQNCESRHRLPEGRVTIAFLINSYGAGWRLGHPSEKYESQLGWWDSQY